MLLTMPTEFLAHTGLTLDQRTAAWNDRAGRLATIQVKRRPRSRRPRRPDRRHDPPRPQVVSPHEALRPGEYEVSDASGRPFTTANLRGYAERLCDRFGGESTVTRTVFGQTERIYPEVPA